MLEQFLKSILAYFIKIEPMNAYIQQIPTDVQYPCYLVNKCDINTHALNSYYFMNNIHPYIRIFSKDEVDLRNKVGNLIEIIYSSQRKMPILNVDGTESNRFIRIENIESIGIPVDVNEIYCIEINFEFDTTHVVNPQEFELLAKVVYNYTNLQLGGDE